MIQCPLNLNLRRYLVAFRFQTHYLMLQKSHPPKILLVSLLQSLAAAGKKTLYIGNSGDLHIARAVAKMGMEVHGSDVTVFGRCIATLVSETKFELQCNDEELKLVFARWTEHKFKPLIQIQFALKIGEYSAKKNDYQIAKYQTCLAESLSFFHKSVDILEQNNYFDFRLNSFQYSDFTDQFEQSLPGSHLLLNFLTRSITKTAAFRFAERLFVGGNVKLIPRSKQNYTDLFRSHSISIFSDKPLVGMDIWLRGKANRPNGREPILFYSNLDNIPVLFSTKKKSQIIHELPRTIPTDYVLPAHANLSVVKCKPSLVLHYKHLFMSSQVDYSDAAELALAFLADGVVFGFATFSQWTHSMDGNRFIFMNSDFVLPSATPRLSKLLLYLVRSDEVRRLVARQYLFAYPSIQTTVFTDKPISMKYRGIFQKTGKHANGKLTYTADFTMETLKERFEQWKTHTTTK